MRVLRRWRRGQCVMAFLKWALAVKWMSVNPAEMEAALRVLG